MNDLREIIYLSVYFPNKSKEYLKSAYEECNCDRRLTINKIKNDELVSESSYLAKFLKALINCVKYLWFYFTEPKELIDDEDEVDFACNSDQTEETLTINLEQKSVETLKELFVHAFPKANIFWHSLTPVINITKSLGRQIFLACLEATFEQEDKQYKLIANLLKEDEDFSNFLQRKSFLKTDHHQKLETEKDIYDECTVDGKAPEELKAINHLNLRHQLRAEALKCQNSNNFQQSRKYNKEAEQETEKAISCILQHLDNNPNCHMLDFHHFSVGAALKVLKVFLKQKIRLLHQKGTKSMQVRLITGRGQHSTGNIPKIKPAIKQWSKENGLKCVEDKENPGCLLLYIKITTKI